jgi:peptidylprolyl isomerase
MASLEGKSSTTEELADRLHRLIKNRTGGPPAGRTSVGQLTHTIMKAWSKEGRLHELEKAVEKEGWLRKEVDKVAAKLNGGSTGGEGSSGRSEERTGDKRKREETGASSVRSGSVGAVYGARHLLIKYSGSRKPFSRRTNTSTEGMTAEAARAELEVLAEQIRADGCTQEVFARHAQARSDCGSFKQGGELGEFGPGKMQRAFEEATRACPVGGMSPIVLSDSGFHLIFRYK